MEAYLMGISLPQLITEKATSTSWERCILPDLYACPWSRIWLKRYDCMRPSSVSFVVLVFSLALDSLYILMSPKLWLAHIASIYEATYRPKCLTAARKFGFHFKGPVDNRFLATLTTELQATNACLSNLKQGKTSKS